MKSIRDYLNLNEVERHVLDALDEVPPELVPFFHKILFGNEEEAERAERELEAIAAIRFGHSGKHQDK